MQRADDSRRKWLAVWDFGRPKTKGTGYALDYFPEEMMRYVTSERELGNMVAGPFSTRKDAEDFVMARLTDWCGMMKEENVRFKK